jgi:hypothetical protein
VFQRINSTSFISSPFKELDDPVRPGAQANQNSNIEEQMAKAKANVEEQIARTNIQ